MLKRRQRLYGVVFIVVLLVLITVFVTYYYNANSSQQHKDLSTDSFFSEPVVDLIIPGLFNYGVNAPLNLTKGGTAALIVEVFPSTINLKTSVSASIASLSYPNENITNDISTNISPAQLSIADGSSGNTTLSINVSATAPLGTYRVTVTATNLENASQYWGTIFYLNVSG